MFSTIVSARHGYKFSIINYANISKTVLLGDLPRFELDSKRSVPANTLGAFGHALDAWILVFTSARGVS
jgi:hypothetical protein